MSDNGMPQDPFAGDEPIGEGLEDDYQSVELSDRLAQELSTFVLIEDAELSVSRAETLDLLVDALGELVEDEAIEEWVGDYGGSDFHLSQGRDGQLVISDVFPVTGVIGFVPKAIVKLISAELMDHSDEEQLLWLESLSELTTDWVALLSDEEKMVGHLIRVHELSAEEATGELDALIVLHAGLHLAANGVAGTG